MSIFFLSASPSLDQDLRSRSGLDNVDMVLASNNQEGMFMFDYPLLFILSILCIMFFFLNYLIILSFEFFIYFPGSSKAFQQLVLNKMNKIISCQQNHTVMINRLIAHSGMSSPVTPRPSGWPRKLPLSEESDFFAWENFLVSSSNYEYAVSVLLSYK